MLNVFYHTMSRMNNRLVMFLLHGFALLLVLDPMIVLGSPKIIITQPKDKEIFVGDTVVFDWDYLKDENLESLRFGIVGNGSEGPRDITLLLKRSNGIIYLNTKVPMFRELLKRTKAIEDKRASFSISNVRMNDTGKYFCTMKRVDEVKTDTKYVHLKVVDLQIDEKASRSVEESWKNLKISLVCMVRVVENEPVTFTWLQQPNNKTLSRGKHIDTRTESILTIITSSDADFTTYTCVAKTKRTIKRHNVVVKRLYGPGPPLNLQQQYMFDKNRGEAYHKVYWTPPRINGGAKVTDYIVEYKPRGIDWGKAQRIITKDTKYTKFNLKEGKLYDVRVLARNKVDEGSYSNEVEIKIPGGYPSTGARSNSSSYQVCISWWSYLLTLALLFPKVKYL